MNIGRLEKNLCDTVKEWQVKLGYQEEAMGLYYPMESLMDLLETKDENLEYISDSLRAFAGEAEERLGKIEISHRDGRFCLKIPAEGTRYIHEHWEESEFLKSFLEVMSHSRCTIDDIRKVFFSFAQDVVEERMAGEENEYIFYFAQAVPDEYVYCIHLDEFGAAYHRFTRSDYEKLKE